MRRWALALWRQLRWRVIASHLIIVVVGVVILLLVANLLIIATTPEAIRQHLADLTAASNQAAVERATLALLTSFRTALLTSLFLAAIGAIVAGSLASLWLTRGILKPLNDIARSSRRIAAGHYDERIILPDSTELAYVARNFNQMAETLAQVEAQRVALIGNVSHELRTPLTGIEGYLTGLMDGVFPDTTETLAHMYQEVRRLRRLVNDLQSLSRVEAGQLSLKLERFDIVALGKRIVTQLQPQTLVQALDVVTLCADETIMVYADADRTAQILLNLIGNAIRYTPDGGQITLICNIHHQFARVSIEDTGIGIPADALPYIFERFYRVDSSRSRVSGGSGIGLTISRHLARAMGGELAATSAGSGKGSCFVLKLPLEGD